MMMGIDKSGYHDHAGAVDHLIRLKGVEGEVRSDGGDRVVLDENSGLSPFCLVSIESPEHFDVLE